MARLVVISKAAAASSHELGEGWTTIGRADGNTFQIIEPSISGRHCEVRLHGGELLVHDLLSTNGTFVSDRKISQAAVKSGQTLRLGEVELCFEMSAAATPSPAPRAAARGTCEETVLIQKPAPPPPAPGTETQPVATGDEIVVAQASDPKSAPAAAQKK